MTNSHEPNDRRRPPWRERVAAKALRKLKARRETDRSLWFGLGVFGIVGWSVVIPTLAGIALGVWIDTHTQTPYSWTLMLLFVGLAVGCLNAWYWIQQERRRD